VCPGSTILSTEKSLFFSVSECTRGPLRCYRSFVCSLLHTVALLLSTLLLRFRGQYSARSTAASYEASFINVARVVNWAQVALWALVSCSIAMKEISDIR